MSRKLEEIRRYRSRRWWVAGATLAAVIAFSIVFAAASGAVLAGTTFEGNDGNMVVNGAAGATDWANISPITIPDGSGKTDDTIGSSKEDDPFPEIVTQSAPPKDDFTSVHLATQVIGTDVFLYQSSIRAAPNGSANENVELNQSTTLSPNGVTPVRTQGDKLITFDFGGGTADITILNWNTSSSTLCADHTDSQPCWDTQTDLVPTKAEGAVNDGLDGRTGAITAANNTLTHVDLDVNEFQEMAVNLTGTGILPSTASGDCETFASATIKSRSSGATGTFNSDLKDIVIAHKAITNCGSIVVKKVTNPSPDTTDSFTFSGDAAGSIKDGGTITVPNLVPGTYHSTEAAAAGFDLTGISCDDANSATASSGDTSTRQATFKVDPGETVTCTFTNSARATITVKKLTDPSGDPASFNFTGDITASLKDGEHADAPVVPGTYHVTEAAKTGWAVTGISCDKAGSSGDTGTRVATFVVAAGDHVTCTYTNTKQATIEIVKHALGAGGTFDFTISDQFEHSEPFQLSPASSGDTDTLDIEGVAPGNYTVVEAAKAGWALTGLSCSTGDRETADNGSQDTSNPNQANIHITAGGFVQCTYTNTKLATLIVVKNVDNSNGGGSKGPADFNLHVTTQPAGIELSNSPAKGSSTGTTYSGLMPGTYKVSEDAVSGYSLTGITGCLADGSVVLEAGATVTCTLTNKSAAPPPPPPPPAPPAPRVDLQITKTGTPNPATLGNQVTWTMVVTNNGPNGATGVTVADPVPAGTTFVSVASSAGTCTGGAVVNCQLGNMAVGSSVTITLVTAANTLGTLTNTATTVAKEQETNTANNTATASVVVQGAFVPKPPVRFCTAVSVAPKRTLFVGRKTTLTLKVSQNGKPVKGIRIKVNGTTLAITTAPSNAKGLVKVTLQPKRAGILTFAPVANKGCANPRIGVTGVFTPPVTG